MSEDDVIDALVEAALVARVDSYKKVVSDGRVDALAKSVVDAFMKARDVPDQEVRIYLSRPEDIIVTVEQLLKMGKQDNCIDMVATRASRDKGKSIIEFKNGSCIALLPEKR